MREYLSRFEHTRVDSSRSEDYFRTIASAPPILSASRDGSATLSMRCSAEIDLCGARNERVVVEVGVEEWEYGN